MGTTCSYLAITQIATKVLFLQLFLSLVYISVLYFGGQLIGGLQGFLLAGDHESKGFRTFKVEYASYIAPLAPISSVVLRDLLLL